MTTTITATPNTSNGSVVVEVAAPLTATLVSLTRTDVNGLHSVRLYADQDLSDGELVVTDAEAALTGSVVYAVTVDDSGLEDATDTATFDGDTVAPRIAPAVRPDLGVELTSVLTYTSRRETTSVVHQVIGRADPLVSIGVQAKRTGQMGLFCLTYADALAVEDALGTGEILLLRQQDYPGLDMYFTGTASDLRPFDDVTATRRWEVTVEFTEVAWPTGDLFGSIGWTVGASLARNATLADSMAEFATIGDLAVGP